MAFLHRQMVYATASDTLFAWITDMITQGWQVYGSGDGSAFSNEGQTSAPYTNYITSAAVLATKSTNVGAAWIRLRSPVGASHVCEYLIQCNWYSGSTAIEWRIAVSRNGTGYNSGASAWTRPVAADDLAIGHRRPNKINATTDFSEIFPGTAAAIAFWSIGDARENFDFLWCTIRQRNPGGLFSYFGRAKITRPWLGLEQSLHSAGGVDPDPFVYLGRYESNGATPASSTITTDLGGLDGVDVALEAYVNVTTAVGAFASFKYGSADPFAGTYPVALAPPGGYVSAYVSAQMQNNPLYSTVPLVGSHSVGPVVVAKGYSATARNFIKGVYSGNLFKWGWRSTLSIPIMLKPQKGPYWYMNFNGFCIVWEPYRGIIV